MVFGQKRPIFQQFCIKKTSKTGNETVDPSKIGTI